MTLFLHGFTGSPASGDALFEGLGRPSHWEAPWLLGHGAPPERTESASFEEEAEYLLETTTSRVCIGYSLGSRLALAMGLMAPERFDRLVLIGVHPGLDSKSERAVRQEEDEQRARILETGGLVKFVDEWQSLPLFDEERLGTGARAARRSIRLGHTASGLAAALRTLGLGQMPAYKERLTALPPAHIVAGERDTKFRNIAADIQMHSQATVHLVPNAGHDALLWDPVFIATLAGGAA